MVVSVGAYDNFRLYIQPCAVKGEQIYFFFQMKDKKMTKYKRLKKKDTYLHCLLVGECGIILHFLFKEVDRLLLFQASTCSLVQEIKQLRTGIQYIAG